MTQQPTSFLRLGALACSLALSPTLSAGTQQTFVVDTTDDTVDAAPGDGVCADATGACSLRAAVQEANASGVPVLIRLDKDSTYTLTLAGADEDAAATGDLDVSGLVSIDGRGATVDAGGLDRAFDVLRGARLSVDRLTISGGVLTAASGAGLRNAGTLEITRSLVSGNGATGAGASGGGVFNDGGQLLVDRSDLTDNDAERAGGAIEAAGGQTSLVHSTLADNTTGPSPGNGGGLHLTGAGEVRVDRCSVSDNTAAREGGGLWNAADGIMIINRTDLEGNSAQGVAADDGGGALFNDGGHMELNRSSVRGNTALEGSGSGGGLFNNGGVLAVTASVIEANQSNRAGGGVEANGGMTALVKTRLLLNSTGAAPGNGGGLHLTGAGSLRVDDCVVQDNTAAAEGGGLWNSADGNLTVSRTRFDGNVASGMDADQGGGALFNDGGLTTVEQSRFRANVADGASGSGGAVLNNGGGLFVSHSRFGDNLSQRAGGAIEANVGTTTLFEVDLVDNLTGAAPGNGGGLHLTGAGRVTVEGGSATRNDAAAEGGALWNSATGTMIVAGTRLKSNTAPVGADVFNDGGIFTVDGVAVPVGP